MHISEGVLKPEILLPCWVASACVVAVIIYKLKTEQIPKIACLSAIFFVASFIHFPLGPTSIHLVLSGFIGAILGFEAILAIFVGLFLQALFFGYGGLSVLGVNTLIIAFPAVLSFYILKLVCKFQKQISFFLAGFVPILLSSFLLSLVLAINGDEFFKVAVLAFGVNAGLALIEGVISLFGLSFIYKVKKEILPR